MNAIAEKENELDSETSELKDEEESDDSDEEGLGRSKEVIDLEHVSVVGSSSKSTSQKQKAIIS